MLRIGRSLSAWLLTLATVQPRGASMRVAGAGIRCSLQKLTVPSICAPSDINTNAWRQD
jgi:hypothetical protein